MSPMRIHIGHHFYGSGNVGDDLMLAGFLTYLKSSAARLVELTACTMFDRGPLEVRFPEVRWRPYTPEERESLIAACDVWVGLGDSPFQTVVGDWFLDHLVYEADLCARHAKLMYFLGVGVNDLPALDRPQTRRVLGQLRHVWTRDARSAEWLGRVCDPAKITAGADLAHLFLREQRFPPPDAGAVGYVLNFESPEAFPRAAVEEEVRRHSSHRHHWLVQEVRPIPGSEQSLYDTLPADVRSRVDVRIPDYGAGSARDLVDAWGVPGTLVSSRYHALLVGAYLGSRLAPIERNDKVSALVDQLGLERGGALADAVDHARPVPRATLDGLADSAAACCAAFLKAIEGSNMPDFGNVAALASEAELELPMFREFMAHLNDFAGPRGLRTFTNWSKVWEYPWLWFAALGKMDWRGRRLVDLGTELSPLPWMIGRYGVHVTLVETHGNLIPTWDKLRAELGVEADYRVVASEALPLPDSSVDVVTSFSVIEHQPDKKRAVDEVVRVLKPGGIFAVSFDVCEPSMGMTFPEWNGRALTMKEFEEIAWFHPAFGNDARPNWNTADLPAYVRWHRQSAPHHNYATGAAVLVKRR